MTKRQELEEINNKLNELNKRRDEFYNENFELSHIRNTLTLEFLKEEKLLKGTKWDVFYCDGQTEYFRLDYIGDADDGKMNEIKTLLKLNYHDSISLESSIKLKVSDNDAMIEFDDIEELKHFIVDQGLIVSFYEVDKKIEHYSKTISILENFKNTFNK